jgi:molybdate transport system regulatory protein
MLNTMFIWVICKMTNSKEMLISLKSKIWIEANGSVFFGNGRAALFEAIEATGSIRQAASKLGMSYRTAWGKINATEKLIGFRLVERQAGGHQSGATLTPYAKNLLSSYQNFKKDAYLAIEDLFQQHFANLLPKNSS